MRVSDERLKEYENGNAAYQLQINEMRAIARELREYRQAVRQMYRLDSGHTATSPAALPDRPIANPSNQSK